MGKCLETAEGQAKEVASPSARPVIGRGNQQFYWIGVLCLYSSQILRRHSREVNRVHSDAAAGLLFGCSVSLRARFSRLRTV